MKAELFNHIYVDATRKEGFISTFFCVPSVLDGLIQDPGGGG